MAAKSTTAQSPVATKGTGSGVFQPEPGEYLRQVILLFVGAIPGDAREKSKLEDGTPFPKDKDLAEQQDFLMDFVRAKLDRISRYENISWLNGQLPFVSPREIQIWRMRQFAEFIWDWNLPDDDDVAVIFNLTKRQATNLIGDFHAKFRKVYVYPRILRILLNLRLEKNKKELEKEVEVGEAVGRLYQIPSKRYVTELNTVIGEIRDMPSQKGRFLRLATIYKRNDQLMWVSEEVVEQLNDSQVTTELLKLHPIGG